MRFNDALPEFFKAIPNPFAKSDHDLIVLRITLTLVDGKPQIVFDLTGYGKIGEQGRRNWRLALAEIGIPDKLNPESMQYPTTMTLPLQVQDGLKAGLALMNPAANLPLWLDLVRPYGFLGILPWEQVLSQLLERPVLRLPDFLERPRENSDVLEAAILFDPQPSTSPESAAGQLKVIVDEMLAGSPRAQTRIHVFSNAACGKALATASFDKRIVIHVPNENTARETVPDKCDDLFGNSPWFHWIGAALKGRSLDAVHFVCRARATESVCGLLLCNSPFSHEQQALTWIDIGDVGSALIRLGAWAAMFSPPSDDSKAAGMALVADTFAQSRPGSVLFHAAAPDSAKDLRESFRFLFSPGPSSPPKLTRGFLYCQPATVAAHASFRASIDSEVMDVPEFTKQASWVDRARARAGVYIPALGVDLEQPPNWASATQRYVESATMNQLRRASTDVLFTKSSAKSSAASDQVKAAAQSETVQKTLSDIQNIVGSYLKKSER
jgi:hypothetical protein